MAANKYKYAEERGGAAHRKGSKVRMNSHGILRSAFLKLVRLLNPIEPIDATRFGIQKIHLGVFARIAAYAPFRGA